MKEAVQKLLEKSSRAIHSAVILLSHSDVDSAAGRAYYAMLYTAEALLYEKDLRHFSRHGAVHAAYGKEFAKNEELDPKFHRWLIDAFDKRLRGDYDVESTLDENDVGDMIKQADEFLLTANRYLSGPTLPNLNQLPAGEQLTPQLAKKYGLTAEQAQELLSAFDDLLNLDRHKQGIERFKILFKVFEEKTGQYLLDQLKDTPSHQGELRQHFIADALGETLNVKIEEELVQIIKNNSFDLFTRKHAVYALGQCRSAETKKFLLELFLDIMKKPKEERQQFQKDEYQIYKALINSVRAAKDPRAVTGLLQIIEEQKEGNVLDEILAAVFALGEIGDNRALEPLRQILKTRWFFSLAPQICLALAKLGDSQILETIRKSRLRSPGQRQWTVHQLKTFDQAGTIARSK